MGGDLTASGIWGLGAIAVAVVALLIAMTALVTALLKVRAAVYLAALAWLGVGAVGVVGVVGAFVGLSIVHDVLAGGGLPLRELAEIHRAGYQEVGAAPRLALLVVIAPALVALAASVVAVVRAGTRSGVEGGSLAAAALFGVVGLALAGYAGAAYTAASGEEKGRAFVERNLDLLLAETGCDVCHALEDAAGAGGPSPGTGYAWLVRHDDRVEGRSRRCVEAWVAEIETTGRRLRGKACPRWDAAGHVIGQASGPMTPPPAAPPPTAAPPTASATGPAARAARQGLGALLGGNDDPTATLLELQRSPLVKDDPSSRKTVGAALARAPRRAARTRPGQGGLGGLGPFGKRGADVSSRDPGVVGDGRSKALIRRILRSARSRVRSCYSKGLAKDPDLSGTYRVTFTIRNDGSVANVEGSGTLSDGGVTGCVRAVIAALTFPPADGESKVSFPFTFSPSD